MVSEIMASCMVMRMPRVKPMMRMEGTTLLVDSMKSCITWVGPLPPATPTTNIMARNMAESSSMYQPRQVVPYSMMPMVPTNSTRHSRRRPVMATSVGSPAICSGSTSSQLYSTDFVGSAFTMRA